MTKQEHYVKIACIKGQEKKFIEDVLELKKHLSDYELEKLNK